MKVEIGKYPKKGNRKCRVTISGHDTFSLCHTLALVILPALKRFKKDASCKGCPACLYPEGGTVEDGYKEWDRILDKMIYSFTEVVNFEKNCPKRGRFSDEEWEKQLRDYSDRVQKGLNLFGKYYQSLWW